MVTRVFTYSRIEDQVDQISPKLVLPVPHGENSCCFIRFGEVN